MGCAGRSHSDHEAPPQPSRRGARDHVQTLTGGSASRHDANGAEPGRMLVRPPRLFDLVQRFLMPQFTIAAIESRCSQVIAARIDGAVREAEGQSLLEPIGFLNSILYKSPLFYEDVEATVIDEEELLLQDLERGSVGTPSR